MHECTMVQLIQSLTLLLCISFFAPQGSVLTSVSLLTTKSADTPLDWLHHRCLCLLKGSAQLCSWLDNSPKVPPQKALEVLYTQKVSDSATISLDGKEESAKDEVLRLGWHPVSKAVNKLDYEDANCTKPVSLESSPVRPITKFFKGVKEGDTQTNLPKMCTSSSDASTKRSDVKRGDETVKVAGVVNTRSAPFGSTSTEYSPKKRKLKAKSPIPAPSAQRRISAFFDSSRSP